MHRSHPVFFHTASKKNISSYEIFFETWLTEMY